MTGRLARGAGADPPLPRDAMRAWVEVELAPRADAFDAEEMLPPDVIRAMGRQGLLGAAIPALYGGSELDARAQGDLCEALGRASASALSLLTVHSMVAVGLGRWGTPAQRDAWLPRLASGERIAGFALSEPEAGSDADGVRTTFALDGDQVVATGVKSWVSFGQIADLLLVVGKLNGRVAALLVPTDSPGLRVEPIGGMFGFRAGMLATITLDGCSVRKDNLVGPSDFGLAQIVGSVLDHGRYCIAWGGVGLAQACLEASVDYCSGRVQFGRALIDFQLVQEMIADMMAETHAARLMCANAAQARAARSPDMIVRTAAAKYYSARAADRAASAALQLHGANGCSDRYPVQRYLRDAKVMNLIEGSTQIQQVLLAQHGKLWASTSRDFA